MLAAIYARYSSDAQAETSLDDQIATGRTRAASLGLTVAAVHSDAATSGAVQVSARPGGRAMLADALAGRWRVLLVEGLDRLSRDIVDSERTVRQLEHLGVRVIGWADGYDSEAAGRKIMRITRGLVNEVYIDDLRHKTRRGMVGAIDRGGIAAGASYGYQRERAGGATVLRIDHAQAEVVRWIFDRYGADGWSVQRIAHTLNERSTPSPRGSAWSVSAIYGSPAKGSGILNNDLYRGVYVWNRSRWARDPENTRHRIRYDRPRAEWRIEQRPDWRIVTDAQWAAVRARMDSPRAAGGRGKGAPARTLWGGLLTCAACGGAVVAVDARTYGCAARKDRGPAVCPGVRAPRAALDARLLAAVRDELLAPAAIAHMRARVRAAVAEASRGDSDRARERERRAAELEREVGRIVEAIATVGVSPALAERLRAAEAELDDLRRPPAPAVAVPQVREGDIDAAIKGLLLRLHEALATDTAKARQMLAAMLGPVRVEEREGEVWAEAEDRAERLLLQAAGGDVLLSRVAGEGFCTRRRWRIA